jgi:hypothetical protein
MKARPKTSPAAAASLVRAEVLAVVDVDTVLVRFRKDPAEEMLQATLAVPHYLPVAGDRVLVSHVDDECVVLGVLREARRRAEPATLCHGLVARRSADGAVELIATDGALTVGSAEGVHIAAPHITARAERLEVSADRIVETATATYRRAEELSQTSAKQVRTIVDETCEIQAKRTVIASDDDTVIDGKRVLLG